jgi:deazaflavin-dependent oxidoreductase (nitroreductase family)
MPLANRLYVGALRAHQFLYERSGGLVGHRLLGVPTLLLRTTGRRSGRTRTNALVYADEGDRYLVVPSNGGADRPPAWLLNLETEPRIEIQIGRDRRPATAAIVGADDRDFERLWELVNDNNRGRYEAYQGLTTRPIPVVALTPERSQPRP